jgi:alpha-galactosidase
MHNRPVRICNDHADCFTGGALVLAGRGLPKIVSNLVGRKPLLSIISLLLFVVAVGGEAVPGYGAAAGGPKLAATPPMGWSAWAHYQCGYTAQTVLSNARALVTTGLAARGYTMVMTTECWMQKKRDDNGSLQADPQRFPRGIRPVAKAIHALGLKVGIYGDAGYATCAGYAGDGRPKGGGNDYFLRDARFYASCGVDYLKLDGCNVYVPAGETKEEAYRKAYAAEHAALQKVGRPVVFSESAAAYFQGTPDWYDVLTWSRRYGQLWREGSDIANFHANNPDHPRFDSVLWNYAYNLPLGRFQKPGNWNDPDFIIAGDGGLSMAESHSQMALWSMMSAPLILSSDVAKLSPESIAIVGNKALIAIDQDPLGQIATLVRRTTETDVLFKRLKGGDDAVAVLNRGDSPVKVDLQPADFGLTADSACRLDIQDLWSGKQQSAISTVEADIAPHDTTIWRIHPSAQCGTPRRMGTITMITAARQLYSIDGYARCLAAPGRVEACAGTASESWIVTPDGSLRSSGGECLAVAKGRLALEACRPVKSQHWRYTLKGNLISGAGKKCLSAAGPETGSQTLEIQPCGHNQPNQIWSLPN